MKGNAIDGFLMTSFVYIFSQITCSDEDIALQFIPNNNRIAMQCPHFRSSEQAQFETKCKQMMSLKIHLY